MRFEKKRIIAYPFKQHEVSNRRPRCKARHYGGRVKATCFLPAPKIVGGTGNVGFFLT